MLDAPVALVTGGSRGIGKAIALELARARYAVLINYRHNLESAERTREKIVRAGGIAETCQADIGRCEDRANLMQFLMETWDRLDLLVNNAGAAPPVRRDLLEMSDDSYEFVMEINLKGPFFLTQQAARVMIQQRKSGMDGFLGIVNISSIRAYSANLTAGEYCLSKAGLSMMTRLFAARLAGHRIQVFEIRPGLMNTDMAAGPLREKYDRLLAAGLTPICRWGEPHEVARAVGSIARGHFPFSTGEIINVDGGYHLRVL